MFMSFSTILISTNNKLQLRVARATSIGPCSLPSSPRGMYISSEAYLLGKVLNLLSTPHCLLLYLCMALL